MDNIKLDLNFKYEEINKIISSYLKIITDVNLIKKNIEKDDEIEFIMSISSILLVLAKSKKYLNDEVREDTIYKYMRLLNEKLNSTGPIPANLYGGLSGIAFAVNIIADEYPYYKKTLNKLNKLIVEKVYYMISYIEHEDGVKMNYYDIISGISGIALYLMQFKDDYILECVKRINKCLIGIAKEKSVYDVNVTGLYISSENQFLEKDKDFYTKGSFNFGLSHGICSPLVAISLSYENNILVDGQEQIIRYLLNVLDKYKVKKSNCIFWNQVLSFDEYNNFNDKNYDVEPRASWCYGTPGIARSIYISARAIGDDMYINLAKDSFYHLCKKKKCNEWDLNSPTICHGFSGMAIILKLMSYDENNEDYLPALQVLVNEIFNLYNKEYKYLFKNVEIEEFGDLRYEDNLDILTGSSGVILALMFMMDYEINDIFRILGIN